MGIKMTSDEYPSGSLETNRAVPQINLDCAMKTADLIEFMTLKNLSRGKGNEVLHHESGIIMKP